MNCNFSKKKLSYLFILLTIPSLFFNLFLGYKIRKEKDSKTFTVTNVFDGDTFYLENNQKVRLLNCNAPEEGLCGAEDAKRRLEELILNKKVKVDWMTTDQFGRGVGLVYQGNKCINKTMTAEGWVFYEGRKFEGSDDFVVLSRKAKEERKGIYQPKCYQEENLQNPDCVIKGNTSRNSNEKIYHFPGCSNYSRIMVEKFDGDQWFCTEEEAKKAGYKKASNCYQKSFN